MHFYLFQVIINFPDPAQKSDIVQLRGPRNEVEKCAKFMQKMVAEMVRAHPDVVTLVIIVILSMNQYFIKPGGEQLLCLGPHLQAVPQEHNWKRWIKHQEGTFYRNGVEMNAILSQALLRILFWLSRFARRQTQRLICLLRTATRR